MNEQTQAQPQAQTQAQTQPHPTEATYDPITDTHTVAGHSTQPINTVPFAQQILDVLAAMEDSESVLLNFSGEDVGLLASYDRSDSVPASTSGRPLDKLENISQTGETATHGSLGGVWRISAWKKSGFAITIITALTAIL